MNAMVDNVSERITGTARLRTVLVCLFVAGALLTSYEFLLSAIGVNVNPRNSALVYGLQNVGYEADHNKRLVRVLGSSRVQGGSSPEHILGAMGPNRFDCQNHAIMEGSGSELLSLLQDRFRPTDVIVVEVYPNQTYVAKTTGGNVEVKLHLNRWQLMASLDLSIAWQANLELRLRNREIGLNRIANAGARWALGLDPAKSLDQKHQQLEVLANGHVASSNMQE
ncbi:MAG: hypothetical protein ACYTDT_13855, partial [Planctomycetota bacterium]